MQIKHNRPSLSVEEELVTIEVLRSGLLSTGGEVAKFERELGDYLDVNAEHVVAFSSGSSALFVLLSVLQASGQPIALPAYVCSSLSSAIRMAQGVPYFFDLKKDSPNIDYTALRGEISSRCFASIVPHMYGIPTEIKDKGLEFLIEDCAQSIGAKVSGTHCGQKGDASVYSFGATKLLTSGGQGGAVFCKSQHLAASLRDFRDFDGRHDFKFRFNFNMTEIQAAIGRVQLKKLPIFLAKREKIFQKYLDAGLELIGPQTPNSEPVRYRAILRHDHPKRVITDLVESGIRAIVPIEVEELPCSISLLPESKHFAATTLSLPIYPTLETKQQDYIVKRLKECL